MPYWSQQVVKVVIIERTRTVCSLLTCATEDFSHLDIYLYEEDCDNLYVHHDIILGSFPLCVEWLDYTKGAAGVVLI